MNQLYSIIVAFYNASPLLTQLLMLVITYFVTSSTILLILLFIIRIIRQKRHLSKKEYLKTYNEKIAQYVFGEVRDHTIFDGIDSLKKKKILLNSLSSFLVNISGEYALVIKEVYFNLKFDKIAIKYCSSKNWSNQVYGLKLIGDFSDFKNVNKVTDALKSKTPHVRIQAELSMIKLYPKSPLSFLNKFEHPLSDWGQINILNAMEQTPDIEIPDFSQWYNHQITSISIFAIRMSATYKQQFNISKLIQLLNSPISSYRREIYTALLKFEDPLIINIATERYENETIENKIILLQIISKEENTNTFEFLKALLYSEEDAHLLFHIAEAISAFGSNGKSVINDYALSCNIPNLKDGISFLLINNH